MARLCPLFSGSSGNSYYIGSKSAGVLVDAGRSARQLDLMLAACTIDPLAIQAILVTHEHSDHVSAIRVFAKKYSIPVFASRGTLNALSDKLDGTQMHTIEQDLQIAGMTINSFATSHDCHEPLGYRIKTADNRTVSVSTDLGYISEEVENGILGVDFAVIESNHDLEMLKTGAYPYYLKNRILSRKGHLSNKDCADFLPKMAKSGTTRFILAHLSRDNNLPSIAKNEALKSLSNHNLIENQDFILSVATPENFKHEICVF